MNLKNQFVDSYKTIKETTKSVNEKVLATGEEVLNGLLESGQQWQELGKKAVDGGTELVDQQQDMFLDTLETVKEQLATSSQRFKKIVSLKG